MVLFQIALGAFLASLIIWVWFYFKVKDNSTYNTWGYFKECLLILICNLVGFGIVEFFIWVAKLILNVKP